MLFILSFVRKHMRKAGLLLLLTFAFCAPSNANQEVITFAVNPSSAKQQEVYHLLAQRFEAQHPHIKVRVSSQSLESHKVRILDYLKGEGLEIDVLLAYGGTQLHSLIDSEKITPLASLWLEHNLDARFSAPIKELVSKDSMPYAIPMAYYQWGFYYRKSLFNKLGLTVPDDWPTFITLVNTLDERNITPLNFSGGSSWSTLGWFDYLSLRLLGREKYLALVRGELSFTSPEVRDVFVHWQQLIEHKAFDSAHAEMTWSEILPFFYRERIAMMLNGNFFLAHVPDTIRSDVGFFPFPTINPELPRYESAPTDVAVLTTTGASKPAARKFMVFLATLEAQTMLADYVGKIATHLEYDAEPRFLLDIGKTHLQNADGLVQYFDREASDAFSNGAAALFVAFIKQELSVDLLIAKLEAMRTQIHIKKAPDSVVPSGAFDSLSKAKGPD